MTYKFVVKTQGRELNIGEFIIDDNEALKTATQIINKLGCVEVVISRKPSPYTGTYKHWLTYVKRNFKDLPLGYLKRG